MATVQVSLPYVWLCMHSPCPHAAPIEVSFESPSYTFGEGSGRVEVCVVSSGIVNPVNLALSVSTNSSAQGREAYRVGEEMICSVTVFGVRASLVAFGSLCLFLGLL